MNPPLTLLLAGTSRCDVRARDPAGGTIALPQSGTTWRAQRAIPTKFLKQIVSLRLGIILVFILAIAELTGCSRSDEAESGSETEAEQPSSVKQGTNGQIIVTLDADTQKTLGLQTAALVATQLNAEVKGYGRVIDPTMLSGTVADFVSARATAEASQEELDRLKTLASQNNASARAVEIAEAAAQRDAAQAESARAHFLATAGKAIAARDDLPRFIQSLASRESALVRVDLPAGEVLPGEPATARLVTLGEQTPAEAKFLGKAAAVDPQTQSQGFLFLVESNSSGLAPGAAVTAFLSVGGETQSGIVVPRSAVIRHAGAAYVFLESEGTNFVRHAISPGPPLPEGWFVTGGVKAGDRVVVTGAQSVFSEALNSSGFMSGERD